VSRKVKKKLRAIIYCYSGNLEWSDRKFSKDEWVSESRHFKVWLSCFEGCEYKIRNKKD
jgi:hypothetical protein